MILTLRDDQALTLDLALTYLIDEHERVVASARFDKLAHNIARQHLVEIHDLMLEDLHR